MKYIPQPAVPGGKLGHVTLQGNEDSLALDRALLVALMFSLTYTPYDGI